VTDQLNQTIIWILELLAMPAALLALALVFPRVRAALLRLIREGSFVAAAIVLIIGALTLNTSTQWLKLHFKKQAAPLRVRSLADTTDGIPSKLGNWVQVTVDKPIDPELEAALKTNQYISRMYVDTAVIGKDEVDALLKESDLDRARHLARLQATYPPQAFIVLMVTFNTGLVDTVTHIPDNCYVASGYEPSSYQVKHATCGKLPDGQPRDISYRFITFEDQTGQNRVGCRVGYLFQADGDYTDNPYTVRTKLQNLFERYGYYAKVEMMTTEPLRDADSAAVGSGDKASDGATVDAMNDLLTALLPQLERCLPDWKQLHPH
jgi:hypothetical protein